MEWIADNWLVLLLGGGMVAMHMFGHGHGKGAGHGGGGCCGGAGTKPADAPEGRTEEDEERPA